MGRTFWIHRQWRLQIVIVAVLVSLTAAVYWQVHEFEFVGFDDPAYVSTNERVKQGLALDNIGWAFTSLEVANWHPLTWLSYMLDVELFGVNAGGHHVVNLLFHLLNTALVFWVLQRMTGALWRSALVAAFFGLHPLHVESVAWISERKDVLSAFFWLLTMLGYHRYSLKPTLAKYLAVFLLLLLGLMSKPMVVTLPFVLLLMDFWPLERLRPEDVRFWQWRTWQSGRLVRLLIEKIPFMVLIIVSCGITLVAQQHGDALGSLQNYPIGLRLANSLVAYVAYIGLMLWPANLAAIYIHPGSPYLWQIVFSFLFMVAMSYIAIHRSQTSPWMLFGWLWYVGTLVPVIGLVQVGSQALADRYTYIPLIGLFIILSWGGAALVENKKGFSIAAGCLAIGICVCLATLSFFQARTWKNSRALFERAIQATGGNGTAYYGMGWSLAQEKQYRAAMVYFRKAIELRPNCAECYSGMGGALNKLGKPEAALGYFQKELEVQVDKKKHLARANIAWTLISLGRYDEAISQYSAILETQAQAHAVHNGIGIAYASTKRLERAIEHFGKACELDPGNPAYQENLRKAMLMRDKQMKAGSSI